MFRTKRLVLASALCACSAFSASAELDLSYQFVGLGNWSIDGTAFGSITLPDTDLIARVPAGSTIEQAFLYSSTTEIGFSSAVDPRVPTIDFDGTTLDAEDFTYLGSAGIDSSSRLPAFRADVTAQVAAKVGGGGGDFIFTINDENPSDTTEGEILAVVYSNPGEIERTIAFLDGFSATTGDQFRFESAGELPDPTTPDFEALLSLGIGFSFNSTTVTQTSQVSVNGRRLTSSAGHYDNGYGDNGGLITVGDLNDDSANPTDPFSTDFNLDDELYDLSQGNAVNSDPFIEEGDTAVLVNTRNPSNDDNIFFAAFNITAVGEVVPEPASIAMLGVGGLLLARRRR